MTEQAKLASRLTREQIEEFRPKHPVDEYRKQLNDLCDLALRALEASERPALAVGEPVAWVIPGSENAKPNGFLDAMAWQEGEFTRPLYASPPAAEAEPGWVSVPREPTEAMIAAAHASKQGGEIIHKYSDIYRAMLAASPPAAQEGGK